MVDQEGFPPGQAFNHAEEGADEGGNHRADDGNGDSFGSNPLVLQQGAEDDAIFIPRAVLVGKNPSERQRGAFTRTEQSGHNIRVSNVYNNQHCFFPDNPLQYTGMKRNTQHSRCNPPRLQSSKEKHTQMNREAAATMICAAIVMVFWWAAGFGLARFDWKIFHLPAWFVVSSFGSWFLSVALVVFLTKRIFKDFNLEEGSHE